MKMKRWISLLLAILMMVCCLVGCGSAEKEESTTGGTSKLSDLSGKKIGVVTGSIQAIKLPQLVSDATYLEFNTYADLIASKDAILAHPACFFEPSGMRHGCFPLEEVGEEMRKRVVYGSMSGILCLKSSLLILIECCPTVY